MFFRFRNNISFITVRNKDFKMVFIDIWKYILAHHHLISIIWLPALGHILIIDLPHTIQANQIYIGLNTVVGTRMNTTHCTKVAHESKPRNH